MALADFITTQNITLIILILGVGFTVYNKIKNPQNKSELTDALQNQREKIFSEFYETKFKSIDDQIKELTLLNANHIHTIESKIDSFRTDMNSFMNATGKEIVKLETTIGFFIKIQAPQKQD